MKPGILSKSMESERARIFLVKESAPVVRRANNSARMESERTTKDSSTKEFVPIVRRANSNGRMESEGIKEFPVNEPGPVVRRTNINSANKEVCLYKSVLLS